MTNNNLILQKLDTPDFTAKLEAILPTNLPLAKFKSVCFTEFRKNPELLKCEPNSVLGAIIRCAQMQLEPNSDLGHAYLLPYQNHKSGRLECQLMTGYKGMLALAAASNVYIETGIVYSNDQFHYKRGINPELEHVPAITDRGHAIGVYAIARFAMQHVPPMLEFMTIEEINKIKTRSKSASSKYSPWQTDEEAMQRKTVIRHIFKYIPLSAEISYAVSNDEAADADIQNHEHLVTSVSDGSVTDMQNHEQLIEKTYTIDETEVLPVVVKTIIEGMIQLITDYSGLDYYKDWKAKNSDELARFAKAHPDIAADLKLLYDKQVSNLPIIREDKA